MYTPPHTSPLSLLRLFPSVFSLPACLSPSFPNRLRHSRLSRDCFRESAAPVPWLQCVLIDWIAPAGLSACIWPTHRFSSAKKAHAKLSRPSQDNRVEGKPTASRDINTEESSRQSASPRLCFIRIFEIYIYKKSGYNLNFQMMDHGDKLWGGKYWIATGSLARGYSSNTVIGLCSIPLYIHTCCPHRVDINSMHV